MPVPSSAFGCGHAVNGERRDDGGDLQVAGKTRSRSSSSRAGHVRRRPDRVEKVDVVAHHANDHSRRPPARGGVPSRRAGEGRPRPGPVDPWRVEPRPVAAVDASTPKPILRRGHVVPSTFETKRQPACWHCWSPPRAASTNTSWRCWTAWMRSALPGRQAARAFVDMVRQCLDAGLCERSWLRTDDLIYVNRLLDGCAIRRCACSSAGSAPQRSPRTGVSAALSAWFCCSIRSATGTSSRTK